MLFYWSQTLRVSMEYYRTEWDPLHLLHGFVHNPWCLPSMTSLESNPGKMLKMVLVAQWSHLGKKFISYLTICVDWHSTICDETCLILLMIIEVLACKNILMIQFLMPISWYFTILVLQYQYRVSSQKVSSKNSHY